VFLPSVPSVTLWFILRESFMTEPVPGRYRHFKGGEYEVLGVARHSETGERLVVYRPLYNDSGLWVRPAAMFLEPVAVGETTVPRFTRLGPEGESCPPTPPH
jgi:hypothetical protein